MVEKISIYYFIYLVCITIIIYYSFFKSNLFLSVGIFCQPKGLAAVCATATGNSSVGSFGAFPELGIDQEEVSGSWRTFSQDFVLAIELKELEFDPRYTINSRSKTVALLRAVRQEGRDFL